MIKTHAFNLPGKLVGAAALGALLAGCAGGVGGSGSFDTAQATGVYYDYSFAGSEIGFMEQYSPIPVFVRGMAGEREIAATVAQMNGSPATGRLTFVPAGVASAPGYSVTLIYGQAASGENYCPGRRDAPVAAAGGGGQVIGILCTGPRLRSTVTLPLAPDAVRHVTTLLFSPDSDAGRRRPRGAGGDN